MNLMLLGALAMACLTASLFFLRFWRTTHDRFFLFFAISFFIDGLERILNGFSVPNDDGPLFYGLRLVAFSIIILAIIDKNYINKGRKL